MSKIIGKLKSYKELMAMADDVDKDGNLVFHYKIGLGMTKLNQGIKDVCGTVTDLKATCIWGLEEEFYKSLFEWIKEEVEWSKVPVDTNS